MVRRGISMKVVFGEIFYQYFRNFPKSDQQKIAKFVDDVETYGLDGLQGRNKASDSVPTDAPNWSKKVAYAQKYHLWHYHIGIPQYETANDGEQVSEYILHYQRFDDEIRLVSMSYHPPFELPEQNLLIETH